MIRAALRPVSAGDGVAAVWVEAELGAEDLEEVLAVEVEDLAAGLGASEEGDQAVAALEENGEVRIL